MYGLGIFGGYAFDLFIVLRYIGVTESVWLDEKKTGRKNKLEK